MAADPQFKPQSTIPQDWVYSTSCPVCGCNSLSIKRLISGPDELVCESCGTCFEVAQDGRHVHLVSFPPGLPGETVKGWSLPEQMRAEMRRSIRRVENGRVVRQGGLPKPVATEDLVLRARKLYSLGNSRERVRGVLEGIPGATPAQVEQALAEIGAQEQGRRAALFWIAVALMLILVVLIGLTVALGMRQQALAAAQPQQTGLPSSILSLVGSNGGLLNLPQVRVIRHEANGKKSSCPSQPSNAAHLFGGEEGKWSITAFGWTFFSSKAETLYLPEGMVGEYPVFKENPEWQRVAGPATLENVVYLNISCGGPK